jgi:hypothetical protein
MSYICDICNTKTTTKSNLNKHRQTESCQKIKKEKELVNKLNEIVNKNKEQEELIKILKNKLEENNTTIITLENRNKTLENEIKTLEEAYKKEKEKSEEYRKIVEKAAVKSTTVNNNNTYNRNNYLNYVSTEPIKFGEIQQKINNIVTTKTIMYDNDDFNNYITKNILKDENGKNKVLCTDINRKNFTYKDETSGQMISDPELERLRTKLKNTSHDTSVKKDLLDKLISKYEGTRIDPYVRFYECLQNIEYGQPFVEHVAKKTYVKGQSSSIQEYSSLSLDVPKQETISKEILETSKITLANENPNKNIVEINVSNNVEEDDIDVDNVNINEIEDMDILDKIIDKYEKKLKMMNKIPPEIPE